jgi:hypothetical protein
MMTRHVSLSLIFLTLTILLSLVVSAQSPVGDLLLYYDIERESLGITTYNPSTGEKIELPVTSAIDTIRTSGDGRIAYIQDNDIWVLDVLNSPNSPTNITQTPDEHESLLDWTPDGSLLEFHVGTSPVLHTYDGNEVIVENSGYDLERYWNEHGWYVASYDGNTDGTSWYVWNGQARVDLTLPPLPAKPAWQTFHWTPENHLFITIGYSERGYMQPVGPTNIFHWNGSVVQQVESPSDDETFMLGDWSADGRLTLYTTNQVTIDQWYVWDGVAFTPNGVPDTSTLAAINDPTKIIEDIAWMPDGRLVIVARGHPISCHDTCASRVYLWDSQTLHQLTARDHNSFLVDVHDNGYIAVSDFDGLRIWGVTVYDSNLQPIFQSAGAHTLSRWSVDGNLAYCRLNDLLVWNGQDTTQLSSSTFSKWLIAPSRSMVCSTG